MARAVQGLGAAIASPTGLSIITTTFTEGAERNARDLPRVAGAYAGVPVSGIPTSGLSWRWVLFVNVRS